MKGKMRKFLPEQYRHLSDTGVMLRFNHDTCGDTKERLYVTRLNDGWIFHCHNCAPQMSGHFGDEQRISPPKTTLAKLIDLRKEKVIRSQLDRVYVDLPEDFDSQFFK